MTNKYIINEKVGEILHHSGAQENLKQMQDTLQSELGFPDETQLMIIDSLLSYFWKEVVNQQRISKINPYFVQTADIIQNLREQYEWLTHEQRVASDDETGEPIVFEVDDSPGRVPVKALLFRNKAVAMEYKLRFM